MIKHLLIEKNITEKNYLHDVTKTITKQKRKKKKLLGTYFQTAGGSIHFMKNSS